MGKIRCQKCGSENNVEFCTVDGVCDENGNSIGVPLCADCEESDAYDEAFPPGDNEDLEDGPPATKSCLRCGSLKDFFDTGCAAYDGR
jgi:hypothetical protein